MRIRALVVAGAIAVSLGIASPASAADNSAPQARAWIGLPTTISFTAPQMYVGVPATLTVSVTPNYQTGSVTFWANYDTDGLGPSQRISNGTASLTFMPGTTGWQTFGVSFTPDPQQGTTSASSSSVVYVKPAMGVDSLTVTTAPSTMTTGQSVPFTATATSGATVAVATTGSCTVANGQLTATGGTGTCVITSTSPGANGYTGTASSQTVTLAIGTQTAAIKAPKSGSLAKWKPVVLAPKGLRTNAGLAVRWRAVSSGAACVIGFKGSNVVLRTLAAGSCSVTASAPAVAGSWKAFSAKRSYTIK